MLPFKLPVDVNSFIKLPDQNIGVNQETISTSGVYSIQSIFPDVQLMDVSTEVMEGILNAPGDFKLRGRVTDSITGQGIPYCRVRWKEESYTVLTSSTGYYNMVADAESGYTGTLEFYGAGYEFKSQALAVSPGSIYMVDEIITKSDEAPETGPTVSYKFSTNPGSADIDVWKPSHGAYVWSGYSGTDSFQVTPGLHYVRCRLTGYGTIYTARTVPSAGGTSSMINMPSTGQEVHEADPPPATGILEVTSEPTGAMAPEGFIGGGTLTPFTEEVPVGDWRVFLEKQGYQAASQDVTITFGQLTKAHLTLLPGVTTAAGVTEFKDYDESINWTPDARAWWDRNKGIWALTGVAPAIELGLSLRRVLFGEDAITGESVTPDARDYVTIGAAIIGSGVVAGAVAAGLAAEAGAAVVATEMVNAGIFTEAVSVGTPAAGGLAALIASVARTAPLTAGPTVVNISKGGALSGIWKIFLPVMMIQQLDVIGWGFGWMPEPVHRKLDNISKQINGGLIRLDRLIKADEWESAGMVVGTIRTNIALYREAVQGAGSTFWQNYGMDISDVNTIVDGFETDLEAIIRAYPAIEAPISEIPEEIIGTVTEVIDGDTIVVNAEHRIRFLGMDAHEIGTEAGVDEKNTLNSLIYGKTVTVKIDPYNAVDQYGRILGLIEYNGVNVTHYMLERYGPSLLPPTAYRKRNKHVDWNENKLIAEQKEVPISAPLPTTIPEDVGTLKLNSSPSHATIYLDGEDTERNTAETIENLPAGSYDVTLILSGYETMSFSATVKRGETTEVYKKLVKSPAAPKPAKPSRTTLETHFKGAIITEDDAREGLTDLGYSPGDIDTYLVEWISELKGYQVGKMYKDGVATLIKVTEYLTTLGYTLADIDGAIKQWDIEIATEAEAASKGNLAITSTPKYADIYLDDVFQQRVTPTLLRGIEAGTYTVKCTAYQHQDASKTVTVVAGQEVPVHLDLIPNT